MPFSLADVELHCLENGLRVLLREAHDVPVVTSMIWYRVGSLDEPPGMTGVSHFIEHMLFKGTRVYGKGDIDWMTAVNGGFNNAFTGHDYTAYYFSFASDRWGTALEVEADRMCNCVFDPEEFELERQVILEEWRMGMDNPWEAMRDAVDRQAFPGHPYGNPVIGRLEDLEVLSLERLEEFYRLHYHPSNATLVLVGDFDSPATLARVEELFGGVSAGASPDRPQVRTERARVPETLLVKKPSSLGRLLMALPAPSVFAPDLDRFLVLEKLLSQGRLSRLYQTLVEERELVSLVDSDFEESLDPYQLFIRMELRNGASADEAMKEVGGVFEDLAAGNISDSELDRARNQLRTDFFEDFETTFDQAFLLGLYETLGGWEKLETLMSQVESVERQGLAATAERYCSPVDAIVSYLPQSSDQ